MVSSYHIIDGKIVLEDARGYVAEVVDEDGVYIPKMLSFRYVRNNPQAISRERSRGLELILRTNCASVIVPSCRKNTRSWGAGWHICGGVPCYVNEKGCLVKLYYNGYYIAVYAGAGKALTFEGWKHAVGSNDVEKLAAAAIANTSDSALLVRPHQYRVKGVWEKCYAAMR